MSFDETAELALRMLERGPEQPVTQREQSSEQVTETPNSATSDVAEPPRKRRWWQPTRRHRIYPVCRVAKSHTERTRNPCV